MAGKKAKSKASAPTEIKTEEDFKRLCEVMDDQHQLFCDHYLITLNAADSYRKAGYKAKTKASIENNASRLLSNDRVQNYIQWKIKERKKRLTIDEQYVLNLLQAATKVKITDFFEIRKDQTGKTRIFIKDLTKMPDAAVQLIESITEGQFGITIKLISKTSAIEKLGAHLGMWGKDKEQQVGEGTKYIIVRYIVPAEGNVVIRPPFTPADAKRIITNHLLGKSNDQIL